MNTNTAYCSVCHSAGKSKEEYTSHYLRESKAPDAKTTCPYLLSITCGYCKNKGHTPKYCPLSMQKAQAQAQAPRQAQAQAPRQAQAPAPRQAQAQASRQAQAPRQAQAQAPRNKYSALSSIMEEEEQTLKKSFEYQQSFPSMHTTTTTTVKQQLTGWAAVAATPKSTKPVTAPVSAPAAEMPTTMPTAAELPKAAELPMPMPMAKAVKPTSVEETYIGTCGYSWADM